MIGATVSHYRILEKLGEGGMGAVYLAEDSKLDRRVALKVLPEGVVSDPDRLARFEREAKALAALNHPNIITVHSIEKDAGICFITMELIEGRPLETLIRSGGFDLDTFFEVAIPLADALAAAHGKGITHRDLKPANVMVTNEERRLKILDFGLAKFQPPPSEIGPTRATLTALEGQTQAGAIMGTVPYMSPEQVEGRAVDHRTDIFSLGIILYEMLSGQRPFQGESTAGLTSAILHDEPRPVTETRAALPRHLERIISRCLEKEPKRRYQTARDVCNELEGLKKEVETAAAEPTGRDPIPTSRQQSRTPIALGLAGAALLAVLIWRLGADSKPSDLEAPSRWHSSRLTSLGGIQSEPSLSPDGQRLLFVDYSSSIADIYEQRVGGAKRNNLTEGSGAADYQPAYSPDGQRIAFRSERDGGGLYVMEATGENVRKIVGEGFMPSWSPTGDRVVYSIVGFSDPSRVRHGRYDLRIADLESGAIETLAQEGFQPSWSPSGGRIAFMHTSSGQRDIATLPVEGGEPVWITDDPALDWSPRWAPDGRFLYFASNRGGAHNIWRVAIDQETGEILGDFQNVTSGGTELQGFLSITADGRSIAYAGRQNISNLMAAPYDRRTARVTGPPVAITTGPSSLSVFDISPDGEWIAYMQASPWEDIVLLRADGSEERKLTNDAHNDRRPRFSHDGERIYFYSNSDGPSQVSSIRPDGTGRTAITGTGDGNFMFTDPSPDGETLSTNTPQGGQLFSLTEPYSTQTAWRFPRDSRGRMFAPVDWSSDGRRILGSLFTPGVSDTVTAVYDLDSEAYELAQVGREASAFLGDDHLVVWAERDKLMLHDLRAGESRELLSTAPYAAAWPMLSPDGKTLYFLQQSGSSDIHLLVSPAL